ncbi:hypothetical protein GCM10007094_39270 [Pseudovibrio japonicus]|uniref:Uncharacterized protein n=1 Tax=Pseudovibrio japonicus TaxID=366534 RepID=A0ABQ3ELV4_9HYPH|nr:hypothetical protein GCM10007094_39270 [Pseudovibrio japonicus]
MYLYKVTAVNYRFDPNQLGTGARCDPLSKDKKRPSPPAKGPSGYETIPLNSFITVIFPFNRGVFPTSRRRRKGSASTTS